MALETFEQVVGAIKTQDIDALVVEDPKLLREMAADDTILVAAAGVDGDVARVRNLLRTAWFWSYGNRESGKTGIPDVVRENLNWQFDWSTVKYDAAAANV